MVFARVLIIAVVMFAACTASANEIGKRVYPSPSCILCVAESSILEMLGEEEDQALIGVIKRLLKNRDCVMAAQGVPFVIMETSSQDPGAVMVRLEGHSLMFWTLRGFLLDNQ